MIRAHQSKERKGSMINLKPLQRAIASNVRQARASQRLTQERLAFMASLSRKTISELENAKAKPDMETLAKLADALGTNAAELLRER